MISDLPRRTLVISILMAVLLLMTYHNVTASSAGMATPIPPAAAVALPTPPAPAIHLAYFSSAGCSACERASGHLETLQALYPQLVVTEFPIEEEESKRLSEWLGQRHDVPEEKRLSVPMVFVGEYYLLGSNVNVENLQAVLDEYVTSGAEATWKDFDSEQSGRTIVERFRSFGVLTVVGAGLLDGLNPCAFATIIFFVSYLTISGRKGKEVLAVGAAFTVGVFLTYLAVGLGLHRLLALFGDLLTTLGRWLYGLMAALCAVLAVVSFMDYRKARRGEIGDMALNLPHGLRMRINATIRRGRHSRTFVAGAFVTGILVSLLELACTGQVYLPTIIFVMSVPAMRSRAVSFLVLYNLLFIAPLVVVFILVWYGTTGTKQLTNFLQRHAATVKLGTALLFLLLAGWLFITLL